MRSASEVYARAPFHRSRIPWPVIRPKFALLRSVTGAEIPPVEGVEEVGRNSIERFSMK